MKVKQVKRDVIPRKAKEQTVINLEKLAVIMEVMEASTAVEDSYYSKEEKVQKKLTRPRRKPKACKNKSRENSVDLSKQNPFCIAPGFVGMEINSGNKKTKEPVLLSNTPALSHFMKLEERTDLLNSIPMADPLGPDSFDSFQWVEVKQELPDDIEACKVTLTELPLKVDAIQPSVEHTTSQESTLPDSLSEENGLSEEIQSGNDNWDQESSLEDSSTEPNEIENNEMGTLKKKRKNNPQDCDVCGKKLSSKGSLRLHKLKKHKQKVQFTCDLCGLKFDFQRNVVQHRNATHRQADGRFCCDVCQKRFSDYHSFLLHIKSHINNCKEEEGSDKVCKECDKTFLNDESLKIHQTLTHIIDERELREKLKHQEKNFICHTCGKRFAFNCLLRDHINLHTGSKPYLCQKCGKPFSQKATLKQHTRTHNEVRPFQCPDCPLGFYSRGDLKKHVRKHTGERPYICEVCGEGFSRSSHLGVHRRSHTGERPYSCEVCRRGFTKRGDVVRHQRIHTGELPYLCQVCGKAFRQSTQCANHIKSQHPDAPVIVARNPNPLHNRIQSQLFG